MLNKIVVLFDARREISTKYKKILEHDNFVKLFVVQTLEAFWETVESLEPELILISDSIKLNINELCKEIRQECYISRPVIVVLSKSSFLDDKLLALDSGADDLLSEPLNNVEFMARIKAHLRRQKEELSNPVTNLYLDHSTYKILRRVIKTSTEWALLFIGINNLIPYREIYGEIPANVVLQAYTAMLKSAVTEDDYVGQIDEDNFVVITNSYKAEKMADYMNYAFDAISKKFYTEDDAKKGYITLNGDSKAGCKVPLISASIGIVSSEFKKYSGYKEAINAVRNMYKLAKTFSGSSKMIDRPQLSGFSDIIPKNKKKILIVETDVSLGYLLATTLEMQGFETMAVNDYEELTYAFKQFSPDLVILDEGNEDFQGLKYCAELKFIKNCKIIVTSIIHDKNKVLDAGADLYLPKPYELINLFKWVNNLI